MRVVFQIPEHGKAFVDGFVPLAEGLKELGFEFCANRDYWRNQTGAEWLFKKASQAECHGCDIAVYTNRSFQYCDDSNKTITPPLDWLENILPNQFNVLVDNDDGYETSASRHYQKFDLVLRSHFNRRAFNAENNVPWVLGFGSRVIKAVDGTKLKFGDRSKAVLVNFGASHGFEHGTRSLFTTPFLQSLKNRLASDLTKDDLTSQPGDLYNHLMWEQTQHRHCKAYYDRLTSTQTIAAFCGEMIPPLPYRPKYLVGGGKAKIKRAVYEALAALDPRPARSIQWDSWRFWEGLVAGCLVFNIDLDYYGVQLPVMPENGEHYIGLRLNRIQRQVDEVLSDPTRMETIAAAGRAWAIEHYSPTAMAKRFLQIVNWQSANTTR